jgi:nicotinamidase-related amidase
MKKIVLNGRYYSENITAEGLYRSSLFGYKYQKLNLNTNNTIFMLIDVYGKGFDEPDSEVPKRPSLVTAEMFYKEKEIIRNKIRPVKDLAKEVGFPIVYVTNYNARIAINRGEPGKLIKRMHGFEIEEEFSEGSEAITFSEIIAPKPDDYIIKKHMADGFYETCLDTLLRNLGIKNIIAVGFAANVCLIQTLNGAFYRNYRVILLRDCTLAIEYPGTQKDLSVTKNSIKYIERWIGYTIESDEFKKSCKE